MVVKETVERSKSEWSGKRVGNRLAGESRLHAVAATALSSTEREEAMQAADEVMNRDFAPEYYCG